MISHIISTGNESKEVVFAMDLINCATMLPGDTALVREISANARPDLTILLYSSRDHDLLDLKSPYIDTSICISSWKQIGNAAAHILRMLLEHDHLMH
jgi:hypothetical protein